MEQAIEEFENLVGVARRELVVSAREKQRERGRDRSARFDFDGGGQNGDGTLRFSVDGRENMKSILFLFSVSFYMPRLTCVSAHKYFKDPPFHLLLIIPNGKGKSQLSDKILQKRLYLAA